MTAARRRTAATDQYLLPLATARARWIEAQRLDAAAPFGSGTSAVAAAVGHLGYVQIDTINVVERCHHHILWSRIPSYRRADLVHAQSEAKSIFEYWTHALSYVHTDDLRYFLPAMRAFRRRPLTAWFGSVSPEDLRKVMRLLREHGPQSIRDIDDDQLVEKIHPWASRKPSKKALQLAFFRGEATIAAREGMLKRYDLMDRHFGWRAAPKPASSREIISYKLDRALRSQCIVSLDSICHLDASTKPLVRSLIDKKVKSGELLAVKLDDGHSLESWMRSDSMEGKLPCLEGVVHILSPFDPLIIQRKRLKRFFGYDHLFEAYVPKEKRKLGYFALPVLIADRIAAAIDVKADRSAKKLLIQQWTWTADGKRRGDKQRIEEALDRFAAFQFSDGSG